jgi:Zn-dependent M28 family amino/carboxypeptidase
MKKEEEPGQTHFSFKFLKIFILLTFLLSSCDFSKKINPSFDEENSFSYLKKQVSFGVRFPGSSGHKKTAEFLEKELKKTADRVILQKFKYYAKGKEYNLTNIIGIFEGKSKEEILLGAHYDTRMIAEREKLIKDRKKPVLGANDGASGVAVLLELARLFKKFPPPYKIILVFFDAEDQGEIPGWDWCIGSKYFANNMEEFSPSFAIIIDMVGDKDLQIYREMNSIKYASEIVDKIWEIGLSLNYPQFRPYPKYQIYDDHIPLNEKGIKSVLLIDFDYPFWHTLKDTLDKCDKKSLKIVGDVLLKLIY